MAVQVFTVAEYRAYIGGEPNPEITSIEIVDAAEAIQALTNIEVEALDDNKVTLINATDNALALNVAQLLSLAPSVNLSADDRLTLRDTGETLNDNLSSGSISLLSDRGVSIIDAEDGILSIDFMTAMELLETNISFDAADEVTIADSSGKLGMMFFSAPQITALSNRGADFIGNDMSTPFPIKVGAAQAKALAVSNITLTSGSIMLLSDDGADVSRLSAAEFATLAAKGLGAIDALDGVLTLSFDQLKALEIPDTSPIPPGGPDAVTFNPYNTVTLELAASDLTGLDEAELEVLTMRGIDVLSVKDTGAALSALSIQQIEALKAKGADVLDASDNILSLTYDQYKATNGIALTASDTVTVSLNAADVRALTDAQAADAKAKGVDQLTVIDSGQALAALTAAEIAALSSKGVGVLDATDNKLALSLAQYKALGSVKLSATDVVTVAADGDAVLSAGGKDLTLTGNAVRGTGNSLANTITGNAKNNILSGLEGDDFLAGGLGKDQLSGGAGKDVFVFNTKLNKSTNVDKVTDFKSKDDSFYLDNKYFTKLGSGTLSKPKKFNSDMFVEGTKAKDKEDRIVYDKKTGTLYYDVDGTGKSAQVKIATLSNKEKLTYHDFFVI